MPPYFHFPQHPGDFFRNESPRILPDPQEDLESFLLCFLEHYQSDVRVMRLNDFYKKLHNDFESDAEEQHFEAHYGSFSDNELLAQIQTMEDQLKQEAYQNYKDWICSGKIILYS